MYLGECPKIKDGHHFHGNEAREKNHFFSSILFILIIRPFFFNYLVYGSADPIFQHFEEIFFFYFGHYFLISWFTDFLAAKTGRSVGKK